MRVSGKWTGSAAKVFEIDAALGLSLLDLFIRFSLLIIFQEERVSNDLIDGRWIVLI